MGRRLIVTATEVAAGWVVRPADPCADFDGSDHCRHHRAGSRCCLCGVRPGPPADLLAAAAPCETCRGSRLRFAGQYFGLSDCPDCRIELVGECPQCDNAGALRATTNEQRFMADPTLRIHRCLSCHGTCTVTIGHAYAVGGVEMRDDSHYMLRLEVVR